MDECEKCGIDLSEVSDKRPQIELECQHNGNLGLMVRPGDPLIVVRPGDAFEIKWKFSYPSDGGPPTIKEVGRKDEHREVPQGDRSGADAGGGTGTGAITGAGAGADLDAYSDEGARSSIGIPDSIEKVVGYRGWVITGDEKLGSTAHRDHVWKEQGPEVAYCQRERDGHHVSLNLFKLRQQAELLPDGDPRKVSIQANIDREIMTARRSPERNCMCGIYAVYDPLEIAPRIGNTDGIVYGRVKAWGKIAEYDKGFRAEKVEVDCLYRPRNLFERRRVARIAKKYGVEVEKPPVLLDSSETRFWKRHGYPWFGLGFAGMGIVGAIVGGLVGYLAATLTYSVMFLSLVAIGNRRSYR